MTSKFTVFSFALLCALFLFACFDGNSIDKANLLFKERKYDEALKMYEMILQKKPKEQELAVVKAIADIKVIKKDFPGAIESYKKVIELSSGKSGVQEMVSMLSYTKAVRDKAADTIKSIDNGKTDVINEILAQIAAGNNYTKIDYLGALARIGRSASFAAGAVAAYLDDGYFGIRKAALETLGTFDPGRLKEAGAIVKMVQRLDDENITVAEQAIKSLGALKAGANEAVADLIPMLARADEIKDLAKQAIIDIGPSVKSEVPRLIVLTDGKRSNIERIAAIDALAAMGSQANDAVPVLIPLLKDKNNIIRTASANALTKIGKASNEAIPDLIKLLKDKDHDIQLRTISELSDLGRAASAALEPLKQLSTGSNNKDVREEAKIAYNRIQQAKR